MRVETEALTRPIGSVAIVRFDWRWALRLAGTVVGILVVCGALVAWIVVLLLPPDSYWGTRSGFGLIWLASGGLIAAAAFVVIWRRQEVHIRSSMLAADNRAVYRRKAGAPLGASSLVGATATVADQIRFARPPSTIGTLEWRRGPFTRRWGLITLERRTVVPHTMLIARKGPQFRGVPAGRRLSADPRLPSFRIHRPDGSAGLPAELAGRILEACELHCAGCHVEFRGSSVRIYRPRGPRRLSIYAYESFASLATDFDALDA